MRPQDGGVRRGGRLQRAQQSFPRPGHGEVGNCKFDSDLAFDLVRRWAWGEISAVQVQRLARKSYDDQSALLDRLEMPLNHIPVALNELAKLGCWGRHDGNINKELIAWLGHPVLPQIVQVRLNVLVEKPRGTQKTIRSVDMPFLLPHLMFSHFYNADKSEFCNKYLGLPPDGKSHSDKLEEFWRCVIERKDPRIMNHPMARVPNWQRWAIPICLHGDAVPVVRVGKPGSKSLDCISFQSLVTH
eukprot:8581540-Pyramimonas_sp.AAC.1